jgi:integrase
LKAVRQRMIDAREYRVRRTEDPTARERWLSEWNVRPEEGCARFSKKWHPVEVLGHRPALSRGVINQRVGRLVRMFRWGVAEELVPETVHRALATVKGLEKGRCTVRETKPVKPVPVAHVEAVLPHVLPPVAAMIRMQLLTGARPGEVCVMRGCDIDTTGDVWLYRPARHKTKHRGKSRIIAIGPKAQEVVCPFLLVRCPGCGAGGTAAALGWTRGLCATCHPRRAADSLSGARPEDLPDRYVFSPREAVEQMRAAMRARRKTKVQPSQRVRRVRTPRRAPGERYTPLSYLYAIRRTCLKLGIEPWHPHQLRHSHATEVRKRYGLEAAQVTLGHSRAAVTEIYAERDLGLALKVAAEMG